MNPTLKEAPPEPNPATPRKEVASSITVSPRKQEFPPSSTPATSLGDDRHTSIDASKAEIRSELISDTLEEGVEEVLHKRIVASSSKNTEAISVIIDSPRKEEAFGPMERLNLHPYIRKRRSPS